MEYTYFEGRTSLNFYPKFDNSDLQKGVNANLIRMTEKHSGSLILFGGKRHGVAVCNSKNSSCNDFTRLFMVLFKKYYECVWPDDAVKFSELCDFLYANILCLSFELVVKDRLGQHGAAPRAAYFVLTAISAPKEEKESEAEVPEMDHFHDKRVFYSPIDITEFATEWRLPVNTEWWIPVKSAETVGRISCLLEEWRWVATWSKVDSVISEFTRKNGGVKLEFLSHGDTQGEVLEGLVCQQLSVDEESFAEFQEKIRKYNETMDPFKDDVLRTAYSMNAMLFSDSIEQALQQPCGGVTFLQEDRDTYATTIVGGSRGDRGEMGYGNGYADTDATTTVTDEGYREIRFREPISRRDISQDEIWSLLIRYNAVAFERIRLVYAPHITLRTYVYGARLSVVIEITNDDVFKFFPLHGSGFQLFRGMAIDFGEDFREPEEISHLTPVTIHETVKVKCLAYLLRTFGVRNNLTRLFKDGEDAIDGMIRHFLVNWSVPLNHRSSVDTFLRAIYTHLLCLSDDFKDEAKKNYLKYFESFFESGDPATVPIRNLLGFPIIDPATVDSSFFSIFSKLYVCDFRVVTITSNEFTEAYGVCVSSNRIKSTPLGNKAVDGSVVVVFPPSGADLLNKKMYDGMITSWVPSFEKRDPRNKVLVNPTKDELLEAVRIAKVQQPPKSSLTQVSLVIFPAWPLAAGKSAHAEMLRRDHGFTIVSSDDCTAKKVKFSDSFAKVLKSGCTRIVLDKNIPDDTGLRSMLRMIDDTQKRTKLAFELTLAVPSRLQSPEFYEERILQREGTDHCFRPELVGPEWSETFRRVFYYPSLKSQSFFQSLPGAIIVDSSRDSVSENACKISKSTPVPCRVLRSFESEPDDSSYIAAFSEEVPGHVTLAHRQDDFLLFTELKQFVGQKLSLATKSYLLAEQCNEENFVIEGGHRIGLFVVAVEDSSPVIPPSDLYHITDHGTLMFKTKPVMAKSVMSQYRGHEPVAGEIIWKITEVAIRETIFSATIRVSK